MSPAVDTAPRARPAWLDPLSRALASADNRGVVALRPGRGGRRSAVLALFAETPEAPDQAAAEPHLGLEVLLVERALTLRSHPGQIAFPGGAADPGDVDLVDTALREAHEECGVDRTGVEVLGTLPPAHVAVSGFDVTAVVGWWREPRAPGTIAPTDPAEVAAVLQVPVADLVDPANRVTARHPSGFSGPAFTVAGHLVWGLTAFLLDAVLDLAGWAVPWDATRETGIPARYLSDGRRPGHAPDDRDLGGPDAH